MTPRADRAWVNLDMGAQSGAGLAEPSPRVNRPPVKLSCSRRRPP
jgi:hypothetical protein